MPQEESSASNVGARALGVPSQRHRRRDVDLVRGAFESLQGSKNGILDRIKGLRVELEDSLRARLQTETDLKNSTRRLTEANERIRHLEAELSSLKGELSTAKTMLDEIEKSL